MKLLEELERNGEYTRAAAIAIWNMKIHLAISALKAGSQAPLDKGGDPNLSTVVMALAGFNDRSSLWKDMCRQQRRALNDSYLKAIFAFLTTDNSDYSDILVSGFFDFPENKPVITSGESTCADMRYQRHTALACDRTKT